MDEDTAAVIALAEEERDACPQCGLPKVICRDSAYQFAFEPHEETCWPTYRLAQHRRGDKWSAKHDDTKQATQLSTRFREGHEAPIDAGLGLRAEYGDQPDDDADQADEGENGKQ